MVTAIFIVVVAVVLFGTITMKKKNKENYAKWIEENRITETKKSVQFEEGKYLIYDDIKKQLWVYQSHKQVCLKPKMITECELLVDNSTEYKTSFASAAGRAIVGGVLTGGVGAVIGGVTGKKVGNELVKNIDLIISTSDLNNPYVKVSLFRNPNKGLKKDGMLYRKIYDHGLYWCKFTEAFAKQ